MRKHSMAGFAAVGIITMGCAVVAAEPSDGIGYAKDGTGLAGGLSDGIGCAQPDGVGLG